MAGLGLSLAGVEPVATVLLNAGIIVLLATPVSRVVVSTVEYVVERDWPFATLTFIGPAGISRECGRRARVQPTHLAPLESRRFSSAENLSCPCSAR